MTAETTLSVQPRGLALTTLQDAMQFGKMVADSAFAPKDFRGRPADCVLAIQHGAEIGLSPMQALQSIAVVNGRPSIYGDAAKAICVGASVCEYVTEKIEGDGEAMVATCTAKRRGHPEPVVSTFSVADAKRAKLWGKAGPWTEYPRRMMQLRARGFALRDAFPDILRGLVTAEEAADYPAAARGTKSTDAVERRKGLPAPDAGKSSRPQPAPVPTATGEDIVRARLAIQRATTMEKLSTFRATLEERASIGFYTEPAAAELRTVIAEREAAIRRVEHAIADPGDGAGAAEPGDAAEPPPEE